MPIPLTPQCEIGSDFSLLNELTNALPYTSCLFVWWTHSQITVKSPVISVPSQFFFNIPTTIRLIYKRLTKISFLIHLQGTLTPRTEKSEIFRTWKAPVICFVKLFQLFIKLWLIFLFDIFILCLYIYIFSLDYFLTLFCLIY